ncbi:MAG: NPCBM/NEW2 domain-containing protein [bacterium]
MDHQGFAVGAVAVLLSVGVSALNAAESKVIWLDEMNLKNAVSGWGSTQSKKTVDNRPLTLRGTVYARGIGTHPPGALSIELDSRGIRFKATAGVDDEVGEQGSVEFMVMGDGKKLWSSGILKGKGDVKPCDLDIKGIKVLDLLVDTTPDGYAYDHSDWADARIEYTGEKAPATKAAPKPVRPANTEARRWPPADQVLDKNALPDPADKDEADAVLRRVGALIAHLKTLPRCPSLKKEETNLAALKARASQAEAGAPSARNCCRQPANCAARWPSPTRCWTSTRSFSSSAISARMTRPAATTCATSTSASTRSAAAACSSWKSPFPTRRRSATSLKNRSVRAGVTREEP